MLLLILFALGFGYRWYYEKPDKPVVMTDAEILGYQGYFSKSELKNVVIGRVRLANGQLRLVNWPEGLASNCRVGDHVRIEQFGNRLNVPDQVCGG